jgi:hypothetical protein
MYCGGKQVNWIETLAHGRRRLQSTESRQTDPFFPIRVIVKERSTSLNTFEGREWHSGVRCGADWWRFVQVGDYCNRRTPPFTELL